MQAEHITEVAKGISDFGMMAITAAIFLLLSGGLMVTCFRWFRNLVNNIITKWEATMNDVLHETRAQNEMLADISEGLRPETQLRIRNTTNTYFDLSIERVCRLIKRIRKENHIDDTDGTKRKIRKLLHNMHEDRNSRFDCYTYRGHKLSSYTNQEWIEKIAKVIEGELYNPDGENDDRAYTNVKTAYDNIKLDFYHRLNN